MMISNLYRKKANIMMIIGIVLIGGLFLFSFSLDGKKQKGPTGRVSEGVEKGVNVQMNFEKDFKKTIQNLSDKETEDILKFFDSSPDDKEIEGYCQDHQNDCAYYCVILNSRQDLIYCESIREKYK